jgi:hypothetical protein
MSAPVLRIHPAIGLARVGNSDEYYLAPESSAGLVQPGTSLVGGLPIQPGTEADPISDQDLRDADGALKRQAQRFRIYQYADAAAAAKYPYQGEVQEVTLGSVIDGKTVTDIVWTVHLANKKANCWTLVEDFTPPTNKSGLPIIGSLSAYDPGIFPGNLPPIRNPGFAGTSDPSDPRRLTALVVDAGPRVIHGANAARVNFDGVTTPTWYQPGTGVQPLPEYPVSFPSDHFKQLSSPSGTPVQQLGAVETDAQGRLIVIGGQGTASGWYQNENGVPGGPGKPFPLDTDVNNDGWFDDTADGPVQATLIFNDGSTLALESTAWVVSTDPSFAPQIRNAITLWDEVYDTWLCCFQLNPAIYDGPCMPQDDSGFKTSYQPSFSDDILPLFRAASLQTFVTSLDVGGIGAAAHQRLANTTADADPAKVLNVPSIIRNPYPSANQLQTVGLMPLALGDTGASFLTLTKTQYFFLNQWFNGKYSKTPGTPLTAGEQLDKNVLTNCLGGRFSPGIDLTFIVRDSAFYNPDWQDPNVGPFRVKGAQLDYSKATQGQPFLGVGYTPERQQTFVEPGDVCKFMAIPWHTDYNSCATHLPDPNPGGDITNPDQINDDRNVTLFWSWPAQRPVSVYSYKDLVAQNGTLPQQRFSVRGEGTPTIPGPNDGVYGIQTDPKLVELEGPGAGPDGSFFQMQQVGRFQNRKDMLEQWQNIGTVVQGPAIVGYPQTFDQSYFLEVASLMSNVSDVVEPYPNTLNQNVEPTS